MWARATITQSDPNKLAEEKRIFDEEVAPIAKETRGFKGAIVLSDPSTGKGMAITLWETREDMIANEESGFWQEQIDKFSSVMTGPARREHYEVTSEIALAHTA